MCFSERGARAPSTVAVLLRAADAAPDIVAKTGSKARLPEALLTQEAGSISGESSAEAVKLC